MARIATPWFRSDRNAWYVNKDGQRHLLGEHPEGSPPPRKVKGKWNAPQPIMQAFHNLMGQAKKPKTLEPAVAEIFEKFLDWCQKHRAERTYQGHREFIQCFLDETKGVAELPASALRPFHVIEWVDKHPGWGAAFRRNAIVAVQRPYNWAVELGHLTESPVRKIKKPQVRRREQVVSPDQWPSIRDRYAEDDPFRDLLEFCWESGCRPQEARLAEVRHVHLERHCLLFPPEEAKGKKKWRIIRLTARAEEIVQLRVKGRKGGHIFLNEDGTPWKADSINCRFCRLQVTLGKEKMKEQGIAIDPREIDALAARLPKVRVEHGKRVEKTASELKMEAKRKLTVKMARKLGKKHFLYSWRHGFANRKLLEGHDFLTVAELLGHADGTMLAKVYSHLDQHEDHLRRALEDKPTDSDA